MSLKYPKFYYGHVIDSTNKYLNFIEPSEDNVELTAILKIRSYTFEEMANEISRALNEAGKLDYTVTTDRVNRYFIISASESFNLLSESGSQLESSPFSLLGFNTGQTRAAAITHTSDFSSAKVYQCQAPLWDYTPFENWSGASEGVTSRASSGRTSVVSFGSVKKMEGTISCITNLEHFGASRVLTNLTGLEDAREFLAYITKKRPVEFMEDRDAPESFTKCRLESTSASRDGIVFRLFEGSNGKKIPQMYNTGSLIFESLEN